MRISDWSSDVCSSDLETRSISWEWPPSESPKLNWRVENHNEADVDDSDDHGRIHGLLPCLPRRHGNAWPGRRGNRYACAFKRRAKSGRLHRRLCGWRSEEPTSELQAIKRNSIDG